ncbi:MULTISPECIES: plasmid mobilization protein [Bacteroidota]|uniref:plasmid mobilization protein n=1 Tax=Bacteroidota TaxID=976 RepID=UPI001623A3C5|nr:MULTISPECIES: plasmid mobilization relaxosome protein MobC [Bacteroidota]
MNKKENPRLKNIVIRVNDKEQKSIEANAQKLGLSISDFGRQLMLKGSVLAVQKNEGEIDITSIDRRTLVGLANNLNQLTRFAHERKELPQIESLLKELDKIIRHGSRG